MASWWERDEMWSVSPWNREGLDPKLWPERVVISDCTLRDGEQQVGVVLDVEDKVALARDLDGLGIRDIEAGTPAVSSDDREAVRAICAAGLRAKISALARAREVDITEAVECGVDFVRISYPISQRQRKAKTRASDSSFITDALRTASFARSLGAGVIFSPYDTTRCDLSLLRKLLAAFAKEGCVDRVRLVDTVGAASPQAIAHLTRFMVDSGEGIPLEVHCHDDFGLAVANTLTAVLNGAQYASTTTGGVGERSGNAALEEVAVALEVLYGIPTGVRLELLAQVSGEVARRTKVALQPHKPVVGANSFAHESGTVISGILRDPFTAEPYRPELVGQVRTIAVGKKSGAASIRCKLEQSGFDAESGDVIDLMWAVKAHSIELKRSLTDSEFNELAAAQFEQARS